MAKFFSHFEKAIDAKGRVSVPPSFRAALDSADRLFAFPSFTDPAVEVYPPPAYFDLLERIDGVVESAEAREQLEFAVITRCAEISIDGEGRIAPPERLLKEAGVDKAVVFAGRGARFQIWSPPAFAAHEAAAMGKAREYRHLLLVGATKPAPLAGLKREGAE